eukprot:Opistho-2@92274
MFASGRVVVVMALSSRRLYASVGRPVLSAAHHALHLRGRGCPVSVQSAPPLSLQHALLDRVKDVRFFSRALHTPATEAALGNRSFASASGDALSSETKKRGSFALFRGTELYEDAKRAYRKVSTRTHITLNSGSRRAKPRDYLDGLRAYYLEHSHIYVRPISVRTSSLFTMEEDRRMMDMIKEGKKWTDIMRSLGKNRSAIISRCIYSLDPRLRFGPYTAEEDAAIHAHVSEHGERKWTELSAKMGYTRSPPSLYMRQKRIMRPDLKTGLWTDDERRRFLEGIAKHGRDWTAVAGHVGAGRSPIDYRHIASRIFRSLDRASGTRVTRLIRYTCEEDASIRIAVERHGRDWSKVAENVPVRSAANLRERYQKIMPQWMRVLYSPDVRMLLRALLRGDGDVESKLAAQFKDLDAAKGLVALELGMDDGSQVDWARVNGASGAERSAALDAVEKEIVPRVTAEEWKEGALAVWVPAWRWERPICTGRKSPIAAVANHPLIKGFVCCK